MLRSKTPYKFSERGPSIDKSKEIRRDRRAPSAVSSLEEITTIRPNKEPWESGMPKINRDGVNIYYEVHGSGQPLILTHGYSSTSQMWRGQVEAPLEHPQPLAWD